MVPLDSPLKRGIRGGGPQSVRRIASPLACTRRIGPALPELRPPQGGPSSEKEAGKCESGQVDPGSRLAARQGKRHKRGPVVESVCKNMD